MVQNRTFLGESLLDLGHIEGDALFRALRQHTQSLILKTLFSRHGEFEFERLDELPSHLPLLELNPFLLMLQAQRRLLSHEALRALFELRMDQYPILRERMIQILPLLNLSPDSLSEFSKLAGDQTFANWISGIDSSFHEETLRGLYLMESIDLLTWASQPKESMDSSQVRRMDFSADFRAKSAVLNDEKLMAEYMDLLNKNYYELLEVSPESSVSDIEQAYRKRRLERHPDQFGETLSGQSKRMLDDILSRLDHAFQTLSHSEARRTYDSRIAKRANDSAADSKRFLAAQDLFRQATKYLESEDFFKSAKKSETQSKAVSILQKMRELTYSHSSSERGFVLLGHAHRALEQNNAARDAYRRALEINPSLEEAVNALATLATEEHQSKRAARGFQTLKPFILKGSLFLIFLLSLMGGWQMREEFFPTDRMATRLDPETAKLSFSAVQIRFKDQVAKVTVKSGELQKMPEPVLRSKCRQSLEKMSMYGARQLFLIDEEVGLFAICSYEKTQIFKPRDRSP
jgi:curved DNA-binding protein CbpA